VRRDDAATSFPKLRSHKTARQVRPTVFVVDDDASLREAQPNKGGRFARRGFSPATDFLLVQRPAVPVCLWKCGCRA